MELAASTQGNYIFWDRFVMLEEDLEFLDTFRTEGREEAQVWASYMLRKARVEVSLKRCTCEEKEEFEQAMTRWIDNRIHYQATKVFRAKDAHDVDDSSKMKMRWILTRKESRAAKARMVVLGYQDLDLDRLVTTIPTASRRARSHLRLTAIRKGWCLAKGDVSAAFVQGNPQ
jgi:hypothetical protein